MSLSSNPLDNTLPVIPAGAFGDTTKTAIAPLDTKNGTGGEVGNKVADVNGQSVFNTTGTSLANTTAFTIPPPTPSAITPANLTATPPVVVPPTPVSTEHSALSATTNAYMSTPPKGYLLDENGNLVPAQTTSPSSSTGIDPALQAVRDKILGDTTALAGEGDARNTLNTQYGVDAKQQAAIDAFNQYNSKKVQYDQNIQSIYNNPTIGRAGADAQAFEVGRMQNADLANLAVIAQSAQGNLTGALDIVQRKIDAQFKPMQTEIDNLGKFVQTNNANLTDEQKAQIQKQQFQLQNNLDQLKSAKLSAHQFALQQGITDPTILQKIDAAQTPADAYGAIGGTAEGLPQMSNNNMGGDIKNRIAQNVDQSNQQYIDFSSDGVPYVDQGRLQNMTPYQRQQASSQYSAAGIRTLDSQDVSALTTIDEAKQNLNLFETAANNLLSSGFWGRVKGYTTNQFSQLTQTNPEWRQFQTLRAGLIKSVQGAAAGAPGLRVTGAELSNAAEALPNSFDNKESAQQAVDTFRNQLNINRNVLLRSSAPTNNKSSGGWASLGD